jgi:ribokinase
MNPTTSTDNNNNNKRPRTSSTTNPVIATNNNNNSFDIVVVGSLNVDLVVVTENNLPIPGQTVRGKEFDLFLGGKGSNQACAAARLGGRVAMIGCIGDDEYGQKMLSGLKNDGVNTDGILIIPNVSTGVAIVTVSGQGGENTVVVVPGANMKFTIEHVRHALTKIDSFQYLVCQNEIPKECIIEAFNIAKSRGCKTLLNPAPFHYSNSNDVQLIQQLIGKIDLITPNETEAVNIVKAISQPQQTTTEQQPSPADIIRLLQCPSVIITVGKDGIVLAATTTKDKNNTSYPAVDFENNPVIDTTGAGDCFSGTLALFLARGADLSVAAQFANYASSISVTRKGAQSSYPTKNEMLHITHNQYL